MSFTDRSALKNFLKGLLKVAGLTSAFDAVDAQHEETFVWVCPAGSPFTEQAIAMTKACKVKAIRITAGTTLAVDETNYITGTVAKRDGAGGSATTIGTRATNAAGGGALTAMTPATATVITAASANVLAAGNVLTFKTADAGTTTEPLLTCAVTVEYI